MNYSGKYFQDKTRIIFYIISISFFILNIFTLEWDSLPWVDDISLTDSSVNFVLDGEWRTTAVFGDRNDEVYSLYPPLYQFILIPWIRLFGVSLFAGRSLNILLAFCICLILYRLLRKANVLKNYYSIIFFLLLFWCADMFSWSYRNGRPDIINMLCTAGFLIGYYNKKSNWLLIFFASLIIISGIQSCMFVASILVCICFLQPDKKRVKTAIYTFIAGSLIGLVFLNIYFYLQGHLSMFYYRSFLYSNSIKGIISFL
jgi:4-amino-4-deoxy-L-arabinose transferase-like glycosyltransferase